MNNQDSLNADSHLDQQKLSVLKKQISLTKSQLLELAYDDQKFLSKLQQLNQLGFNAINDQNYNQAVIYLSEAENILQYAASCGKTIERSLIIAILQNQACVYHRMWQLQKSINYIEAIIYNITSFLQNQQDIDLKLPALQQNSEQNLRTSIYFKNKLNLVFYHLQFCAVSSQNQSHQNALQAASKALNIMKQICEQEYNLERVARKNGASYSIDEQHQQLLLELCNIKDGKQQNYEEPLQKTVQKYLIRAKKTYLKFKTKIAQTKNRFPKIQKELQNYSIGYVMQINPTKISKSSQILDLKQELRYLNKIYKAIYISICHFTMATELRLLSSDKFPIDQQLRKSSIQFKTSELHHIIATITAGSYIPCETVYYEHILNSFKNHYLIDLTQKDSQISLTTQNWNQDDDDLMHLQTSSLNLKKDSNYSTDHHQFLSNTKLINSLRISQHNISIGGPQLYSKMKKGMSKNKNSNKQSQKSIKVSISQNHIITPLIPQIEFNKNKSKSKSKNIKSSNLKQSSKSRKKLSRKVEQKIKSPLIHNNAQNNIKKKISDVKQKKNSDMKASSRSKTKSRKKIGRSRHDLQESKEKLPGTKCLIPPSSNRKLQSNINIIKVEKQKDKLEKDQNQISKNLSNNVYIQRTNNQLGKDKNLLKKQSSSINSGSNSSTNIESVSQKLLNLKKNKSPGSSTTVGFSEKESRSVKKSVK